MKTEKTEAEAVQELADAIRAARTPLPEGSLPYAVLPPGYTAKHLEEILPAPRSINASPTMHELPGWLAYVNRFKLDTTWIMAGRTPDGATIQAALDYHGPGKPSWCKHRASLQLKLSNQWRKWMGNSGKWLSQEDMAEFIQDNIRDVSAPPGAEMLEVFQTLLISKGVEFGSSINLDNGQVRFAYNESVAAKTGAPDVVVPTEFSLGIPVFDYGASYAVGCRFRYKLDAKKLLLRFDCAQADRIVEDAIKVACDQIAVSTLIVPVMGLLS